MISRSRRGQLQTMEPIVITLTIVALLIVGGAYFLRAASDAQDRGAIAVASRDDLALLERITTLPELSCSGPASANRLCVDALKADAFSRLVRANDSLRVAYFPMLGSSNITLRVIDIANHSAQDIPVYDASTAGTTLRATRTYVTVLDPASGSVRLGLLEIRRSTS